MRAKEKAPHPGYRAYDVRSQRIRLTVQIVLVLRGDFPRTMMALRETLETAVFGFRRVFWCLLRCFLSIFSGKTGSKFNNDGIYS